MNTSLSQSYARWRKTKLGGLTERLETNLVLDLAGSLSSRRVLPVVGAGWAKQPRTGSVAASHPCLAPPTSNLAIGER